MRHSRVDFGAHLPLMDFGGHPYTLRPPGRLHRHGGAPRVQCAVGQRPHGVLGAVARRAHRARGDDRALGDHDAGDDRVPPGRPRSGAAGQVAWPPSTGSAAVGWSSPSARAPPRRTTSASASTSTSAGPGSTSRSARCAPCGASDGPPFVGRFYSTEGISLEPHPTRPDGPPIWIGELGLGGRAAPHRPAGRRLAGVGLQHDADGLRRGLGAAAGPAPGRTARIPTPSPTRWRRCGSTSPTARPRPTGSCGSGWCRPSTVRRRSSESACRSGRPSRSPRSSPTFARAGVQRVFVWPVVDEAHQLERFWEEVRPAVDP